MNKKKKKKTVTDNSLNIKFCSSAKKNRVWISHEQ